MVDCCECTRQIDGTMHESVGGAILCGGCYEREPKCPGCSRAASPNYLYEDGLCGKCHDERNDDCWKCHRSFPKGSLEGSRLCEECAGA